MSKKDKREYGWSPKKIEEGGYQPPKGEGPVRPTEPPPKPSDSAPSAKPPKN